MLRQETMGVWLHEECLFKIRDNHESVPDKDATVHATCAALDFTSCTIWKNKKMVWLCGIMLCGIMIRKTHLQTHKNRQAVKKANLLLPV